MSTHQRRIKNSPELFAEICSLLASGLSLRAIGRIPNMPSATAVHEWIALDPALAEQYARARAIQIEREMDALIELADEPPQMVIADDGSRRIDPAWVQLQRLKIDTRKWTAAKLSPKKWGDTTPSAQIGIQVNVAMPESRRLRIMELRRASQLENMAGNGQKPTDD